MSDETPRLKLAQLVSQQEMSDVTWNEALARLDALVDLRLLGQFVNAPPANPQDGDAWLVGGAPTGAWSGYAYKIASCLDGAWRFYTPFDGLRAHVAATGATIVYAGGIWTDVLKQDVPAPGLLQSRQVKRVWDTFDYPDGTVLHGQTCGSGNATWSVGAGGSAHSAVTVTGGGITATENSYPTLGYGESITYIEGIFTLDAAANGQTNLADFCATLIADNGNNTLRNIYHLITSPAGWTLQKRKDEGSFVAMGGGIHRLQVGRKTPYRTAMAFDRVGGKVIVYSAGGDYAEITDADVATIDPRYGTWQIGDPSTAGKARPRWLAAAIGTSLADRFVAAGGAGNQADIRFLRGSLGTKRERVGGTVAAHAGAGWVRLATHDVFGISLINAEVTVSAYTDVNTQLWKFRAFGQCNGNTQFAGLAASGSAYFDKVRLTWNGTNEVALDAHVAGDFGAITVEADITGIATPIAEGSFASAAASSLGSDALLAFSLGGLGTKGRLELLASNATYDIPVPDYTAGTFKLAYTCASGYGVYTLNYYCFGGVVVITPSPERLNIGGGSIAISAGSAAIHLVNAASDKTVNWTIDAIVRTN